MKVLNWNIYKNNKSLDKAIDFLKQEDADIICLQEFPPHELHRLEKLGFNLILGDEVLIYNNDPKIEDRLHLHMVIASRFPFEGKGIVKHEETYEDKLTKRYQYFAVDTLYIDLESNGRKFRIFNVHLKCVAGPDYRLNQFNHIVSHLSPERENIICGDFNTFGNPLYNVLLWKYFGYQRREVLVSEKRLFSAFFDSRNLQNPFKGYVTFLKFPLQLDYILLPRSTSVISKRRHLRRHGSDHFPISIDI